MAASGARERSIGPWILEQHIGSGSFAVVWKAHHQSNGIQAAVKEINTEKLNRKLIESLASEISVLEHMKHKNVVCLLDIIKEPSRIYIVLEFCSGGDLAHYIRQRGRVSEATARYLMQHLAAGLKELRVHNLIHRDLKPQNLLLSDTSSSPLLKIADFGFARNLHPAGLAETVCGSPLYMAPEILHSHKYDAKADLWSVGAILFELLVGKPPFNGANQVQLLRNIDRYEAKVPDALAQTLSAECLSLLTQLLRKNPVERISFEEFFCHSFLALSPSPAPTQAQPATALAPAAAVAARSEPSAVPQTSGRPDPTINQVTTIHPTPLVHPFGMSHDVPAAHPGPSGPVHPGSSQSSSEDEMLGAAGNRAEVQQHGKSTAAAAAAAIHAGLAGQLYITPPDTPADHNQVSHHSTSDSLSDSFDKDYVLITNPYNPLPQQPMTSSTPVRPSTTPTRPRLPLGLSAHPAAALSPNRATPHQPQPSPRQRQSLLPMLSSSPLDDMLKLPEAFLQAARVSAQPPGGAVSVHDYTVPGGKEALLKRMLYFVFDLAQVKATQGDAAEALSLHLLSLKLLELVVRLQPRSNAPEANSFTAAANQLLEQIQAAVAHLCTRLTNSEPLPDSASLLYQWAILLSKDGASDELMGNTSNSINLYCKAADVFVFLALDWGEGGVGSWQELPSSEVRSLRRFHKALLSRIAACEAASSKPMLGL